MHIMIRSDLPLACRYLQLADCETDILLQLPLISLDELLYQIALDTIDGRFGQLNRCS